MCIWPRLVAVYCYAKQDRERYPERKAEVRENTHKGNKTNHCPLSLAIKYTLDTASQINFLGDCFQIGFYKTSLQGGGTGGGSGRDEEEG